MPLTQSMDLNQFESKFGTDENLTKLIKEINDLKDEDGDNDEFEDVFDTNGFLNDGLQSSLNQLDWETLQNLLFTVEKLRSHESLESNDLNRLINYLRPIVEKKILWDNIDLNEIINNWNSYDFLEQLIVSNFGYGYWRWEDLWVKSFSEGGSGEIKEIRLKKYDHEGKDETTIWDEDFGAELVSNRQRPFRNPEINGKALNSDYFVYTFNRVNSERKLKNQLKINQFIDNIADGSIRLPDQFKLDKDGNPVFESAESSSDEANADEWNVLMKLFWDSEYKLDSGYDVEKTWLFIDNNEAIGNAIKTQLENWNG